MIIAVYNNPGDLRACLAAVLSSAPPSSEVIVVDDASTDDTAAVAVEMGARVLRLPRNSGAAAARNHGARHARGEILLFVDADVVVAPDAVTRVLATLDGDPGLAAVFGSYDARPRARGTVSQYRNLLHHHVHQNGDPEAFTFWAGCGGIRHAVFEALGGFDEGAHRRLIEDIELGYRLRQAGHRIRLDKDLQGTHLKRWTLLSTIRSDVAHRAVPWARLILEGGWAPRDLNLKLDQRLSVAMVGLGGLSLALAPYRPELLAVVLATPLAVAALNRRLYGFFYRQRGVLFAMACVPLHLLYFLCSGVGFLYAWCAAPFRGRATNRP